MQPTRARSQGEEGERSREEAREHTRKLFSGPLKKAGGVGKKRRKTRKKKRKEKEKKRNELIDCFVSELVRGGVTSCPSVSAALLHVSWNERGDVSSRGPAAAGIPPEGSRTSRSPPSLQGCPAGGRSRAPIPRPGPAAARLCPVAPSAGGRRPRAAAARHCGRGDEGRGAERLSPWRNFLGGGPRWEQRGAMQRALRSRTGRRPWGFISLCRVGLVTDQNVQFAQLLLLIWVKWLCISIMCHRAERLRRRKCGNLFWETLKGK